jgi:glycosyltransferase involved in cell wall biosynthesis
MKVLADKLPSDRLRVAQVVTKFTAGAGGITLRGSAALDRERFEVTFVTAEGGSCIAQARAAGFEVLVVRHMNPELDFREDARGIRELTAVLGGGSFDLVHTHSAKAGAIGRLAARRAGVPAIVHSFHGFPFHEFQSPLRRRAYIEAERRLGRITHYFVTDGSAIAAEAVRLGIAPPDRIRAIASPVDHGILPVSGERRERARALLGIPADASVIGTVARLDYQKAPLDMVEAIAALDRPNALMVWVGDGGLRQATERAIERRRLAGRFLLAGERDDVPELLPAFDVFAMSSLYEGLPCSAVEAMVCGIPVAATAVNSVPEIVIAGRTGLVTRPGDPRSLSVAIRYLLDHPDHGARMATEARAHVGDRFTPEALGRDLTEVYELAVRAVGLEVERPNETAVPAGGADRDSALLIGTRSE